MTVKSQLSIYYSDYMTLRLDDAVKILFMGLKTKTQSRLRAEVDMGAPGQ